MKKFICMFTAIALSSLCFISINKASANAAMTTPSATRGTWYSYSKYLKSTTKMTVKKHAIIFYDGGKKYVYKNGNRAKSLDGFFINSRNFSDGYVLWPAKMKINGHSQKVLKAYERMSFFQVYTKKAYHKDFGYTSTKESLPKY